MCPRRNIKVKTIIVGKMSVAKSYVSVGEVYVGIMSGYRTER